MDYFSYEHFYVIYCKFWELDKDHDLFISKDDLAKHNDHGKCVAKEKKNKKECHYDVISGIRCLFKIGQFSVGIRW